MIGFIGLSHLGLNYSLATAAKGFDVIGYDPDPALIAALERGDFPIDEPGFPELWHRHRSRLRYTANLADLGGCDLVFYALDVRTNDRNESDTGPLFQLIDRTIAALPAGAAAVLLSQVSPGTTRVWAEAWLRRPDVKLGSFYYQVETLIFGAAVQRAMEPERYIVGAADPAEPLPAAFGAWHAAFGCPVLVMRYESAELAKIAINFFLVSTVCTTNTLAEVCESIGADWSEIAPALRLDRRIGPYAYLKPGLGIAGGNLERDLVTVQGLAARHGTDDGVVAAWQANSRYRSDWVLRRLRRELPAGATTVALWGLAYKIDTHSVKNSPALRLLAGVPDLKVRGHDPAARFDADAYPHLTRVDSPLAAIEGADALLIMTPWKQYQGADPAALKARLKGRLVIDPHGVLDAAACRAAGFSYHRLGC